MLALVRVASTKWMLGGILTTFCKDECETALSGRNMLYRDFSIPSGEYMPHLDFFIFILFFHFALLRPFIANVSGKGGLR